MESGMIGKVAKAHRYARERDRLHVTQLTVSVTGDNSTHEVTLDDGRWHCSCDFFVHRRACAHTMTIELLLEGALLEPEAEADAVA